MLTEKTFKLAGSKRCQMELTSVEVGDELGVVIDLDRLGAYVVVNQESDTVGFLSASHWVSINLEEGQYVLHASVIGDGEDFDGDRYITIRVVTGSGEDEYPPPPAASSAMLNFTVSTSVPVRITLHEMILDNVAGLQQGDQLKLATIEAKPGQIYVLTTGDLLLGTLPPDDPLTGEILAGAGYRCTVNRIIRGRSGQRFKTLVIDIATKAGTIMVPNER